MAFLALVFAFAGLANAFGMTPPVYTLAAALSRALGTRSEALILALIFGLLMVLLPAALGLGAAWLSRRLGAAQGGRANRGSLRVVFARYAPTVAPLAFAIWFAHYWFHFASGALAIVPVVQSFLIDHGVTLLGSQPNWALGPIMSDDAVFLLVLAALAIGYLASLVSLSRTATAEGDPNDRPPGHAALAGAVDGAGAGRDHHLLPADGDAWDDWVNGKLIARAGLLTVPSGAGTVRRPARAS